MLVINRQSGSSVVVGDTTVTVLEIRGDRVRLGFVGPDLVWRTEIKPILPADHIETAAVEAAQICGPRLTSN